MNVVHTASTHPPAGASEALRFAQDDLPNEDPPAPPPYSSPMQDQPLVLDDSEQDPNLAERRILEMANAERSISREHLIQITSFDGGRATQDYLHHNRRDY